MVNLNWRDYAKKWSDSSSDVDSQEVLAANSKIGDRVLVEGIEVTQHGNGAPVEQKSPLGYHVSWISIILLNVSQMVGTGVFSTPGTILRNLGSPGLSLLFWVLGAIIAWATLAVYLEYASLFPNRSGRQVVYLEQAYPRPKFLMPTMFAFFTVAFTFASSNAVVLARYVYRAAGHTATEWENKGLAIAAYAFLAFIAVLSTKWSLRLSNAIAVAKLIILVFIAITGFAVLGGATRIENPRANFQNAFEGSTNNANTIVAAIVRVNFAYAGYENAFNVTGEIKNSRRKLKIAAPISLLIVVILYMLCNIAFFAAIPLETMRTSGELTAAIFFEAVYGDRASALPALVAVSAAGNLLAVIIGTTRAIREVARQGLLPWPHIWVSTKPFGTPLVPIVVKATLTIIVLLAMPFGDAFNFLIDLRSYPDSIFLLLMCAGLYLLRRQRASLGLAPAPFRAWHIAIIFASLVCAFLLITPWLRPPGGVGNVSFWYATYCATGLGLMAGCLVYYAVWIWVLPKFGKYQIRTETVVMDDGSVAHRLLKIPNTDVAEYDRTHDEKGDVIIEALGDEAVGTAAQGEKGVRKRVAVKDSRAASHVVEDYQGKA